MDDALPRPGSGPSDRAPRDRRAHRDRRAASPDPAAGTHRAVRPSYPDAAVTWCVPRTALDVVDLAAGAGALTARILAQGVPGRRVTAVEPSPAMRAALRAALPDVEVLPGTAEGTGLHAAVADAVTVGRAWHWFDPPRAAAELARVLRPGGTLALLWNARDTTVEWVARLDEILHRGDALPATGGAPALGVAFGPVEHAEFRWADPVPPAALRALAASRSHLLTLPEHERVALLDAVDELTRTHPDLRGRAVVGLPYRTTCFRAARR